MNLTDFPGSAVAVHISFTVNAVALSLDKTYHPSLKVNVIYFPLTTALSATDSPLIARYKLSKLSNEAVHSCLTFREITFKSSF
jgi:hypothetical protein